MNRRDFVAGCSAIGASIGLGSAANLLAGQPKGDPENLRRLTRERFRALLNESFRVYDRFWNQQELVLRSVKDGPRDPQLDQFVLEFEAPMLLGDETFVFYHPKVGEFPLFVSPADETGRACSAVFSLLRGL